MRIGNFRVLALLLATSTQAWGQSGAPEFKTIAQPVAPPDKDMIIPAPAKQPALPPMKPLTTPPVSTAPQDGSAAPVADPAVPSMFDRTGTGIVDDGAPPPTSRPQLFWLRAEYLQWWLEKAPITPIILQLPDSLADANSIPAGAGTPVFPPNSVLNYKNFSGVRVNTGVWFESSGALGLDATGIWLQNRTLSANYVSRGSPILTRFYDNINNGQQTYLIFSNPSALNGYSGNISANVGTKDFWSFDTSIRYNGYRVFADNADYLFGFRYLNFNEKLDINANANLPDGTRFNVQDHFQVKNSFYGAQVGLHSRWVGFYGFSFDSIMKFAVGGVAQRVSINGSNTIARPGQAATTEPIGLWATAANSGSFSKGKFAVLPDLNFNINYNVTERFALTIGYSAIFVSNVVRINSVVNPSISDTNVRYISDPTRGNPNSPAFRFSDEGMWVQGLNFGARFEY